MHLRQYEQYSSGPWAVHFTVTIQIFLYLTSQSVITIVTESAVNTR